jgi:thiamine kinase-like enzyme
MFARQAAYRRTVADRGFRVPSTYDDHADAWERVRRALAVAPPSPVPCNNDLLAANYIDDGELVWLIDYEYSGTNDPYFELGNTATECGFGEDQVDAWVEAYLGRPPSRADLARARLQRLASEYGWALWGYIQAGAATLDFDFTGWGDERYEKAAATFRGPDLDRLLQDVVNG